jgi:hypothetical protein
MLIEYIEKNYKKGEPIFVSDLLKINNNKYNLSKALSSLVNEKRLNKYDDGVYFLPKESLLNNSTLSPETIAKYKYISNSDDCYGYYGGLYLANKLGLTTQVPTVIDIITNRTNSSQRMILINKQKFYIKPSKTIINNDNVYVLQLLDLLKDIDKYNEYSKEELVTKITNYIHLYKIRKNDIDLYINLYPTIIYKNIYDLRLYNVFA